jgi:hypothetical protein
MMEANLFSKRWIYNQVFNLSDDDVETIQKEIVNDKKDVWRMEQISEEGNDPATSNQKMGEGGPEDMGGSAGGGLGGPEDLGGPGGPEDLTGGGGAEKLPELEETKEKDGPVLDEETRKERERGIRPNQEGNKAKYTSTHVKNYGEDALGDRENKEKSKSDRRTRHIYRGSPLSLEEDLKSIKNTLRLRYNNKEKTVIVEGKSMLDESNLVDGYNQT